MQQQQPALKQQRLERPGKLAGASAAMVVGMQVRHSSGLGALVEGIESCVQGLWVTGAGGCVVGFWSGCI